MSKPTKTKPTKPPKPVKPAKPANKKIEALKFIGGILLMNLMIYTSFAISFTAINFIKEKRGNSAITERLLQDGRLIEDALAGKAASDLQTALEPIVNERRYAVTITDNVAEQKITPNRGDKNATNPVKPEVSDIKQADVQQVLAGKEIKHINRRYPFSHGTAVIGVPFSIAGKQYALMIEQRAPGLYANFWQQVLVMFGGFLLLFIIGLTIGRPWREQGGLYVLLSAIRRMSKGDFSVSIDKEQMRGHFGQLATSINDMAVELNQMERMRQTFISNVSHEIQSPLTSIRGFAQALQQEGLEEQERKRYAEIIESESVRMSKLSDNLMKLTTLEADDQTLHPKSFRLDQQLRAMILACEPIWTEKDILMDVNLDEHVKLIGDEELLSQVWMNLLSNSLKFTPAGGSVSVEVKRSEEGAVVVVSDNGIGISEEDLPHIFERFFKADRARSRRNNGNGSGLGLSIVKVIVDLHGGQVKASGRPGAGTTFTVTLPDYSAERAR